MDVLVKLASTIYCSDFYRYDVDYDFATYRADIYNKIVIIKPIQYHMIQNNR